MHFYDCDLESFCQKHAEYCAILVAVISIMQFVLYDSLALFNL